MKTRVFFFSNLSIDSLSMLAVSPAENADGFDVVVPDLQPRSIQLVSTDPNIGDRIQPRAI